MLGFEMADHRLDGGRAAQLAFDLGCHAAFLAGYEDPELVIWRVRAFNLYGLYVSLFLFKKNDRDLARKYSTMFLLDYIEKRSRLPGCVRRRGCPASTLRG
jgi:hypothetical protein